MRRIFQSAGRLLLKTVRSPRTETLALGAAAGAMLLSWGFQWIARLGTSLAVVSALGLGILLGLELGFRPLPSRIAPRKLFWGRIGLQGFLILWTLGFGWAVDWQTQLLGALSPTQLANPSVALAVCFGFALVLIAPAVFVLAKIPFCQIAEGENGVSPTSTISIFMLGLALGVLVSAFGLSPVLGLWKSTLLLALLGMGTTFVSMFRSSEETHAGEPEEVFTTPAETTALTPWGQQGREVWMMLMVLSVGGLFAWISRAVDQLMPTAVSLAGAKWSCLAAGWALGFWWNGRRKEPRQTNEPGTVSSFFLGAWGVLIAAAFPWLVDLCLSLTVNVPNVFLLTGGRLVLVFALIAPLGFGWGRLSKLAFQMERNNPGAPGVPLSAPAFLAGWLLGLWVLVPIGSMPATMTGLALVVFASALARLVLERAWPAGGIPRALVAVCSLVILTSFLSAKNYSPAASAQLLFAGPVFVAHQSDLDRDLLTAIDEGRLIDSSEGRQGTYTLWKYRGVQYQIRQSGLPKGMDSGDVTMCPEFSAELLPAAMPLVLHERPNTILILGLGSGVPLSTALAFPTQEVTCVESDPALIALAKKHFITDEVGRFPSDSRLTILPIDPALLLRSKTSRFDVIVSLPHQPTIAQSAAYFTETFYRHAAAKLSEDGLFCQRFAFVDFGPGALRVAARTMQAVFQDVVFLEMAGGEMLLLGTNSPKGVAREGFMDRLQKEHVRRQLAALGWDWSIPLNLSAFNHEALKKFAAETPAWGTTANTPANGTLAFRLPAEMMRWGPKASENQQALAGHAGRFAQWGGIDPEDPDLLRRLAEVTGQRKLMISHPDEYWVYRKTVKDQVTQRPRSVIVQVKGEMPRRQIHEEEKRRIAYFRALGATLKHHPHRPEDIALVESYSEPYDPLVTFFLHQEAAELHSRSEPRNYPAELAHRLHSVFYSAPGDRSVRNVTAAMELLCEQAEAARTPLERWDHLNSLLQMMKQRWAIRAGLTPASAQVALNDIDKSLAAVKTALKTMDDLQGEAGIPADDWRARRRFLETTIVHPLRGYRRQLLPFGERERLTKEKKDYPTAG